MMQSATNSLDPSNGNNCNNAESISNPNASQTTSTPSIPFTSTCLDLSALNNCLQCSLCLSLICEPISITCGHTFCRVCLVESLRRHKKKCPSCRAICHVTAETAPENIMIKSLAIAVDPDGYAGRLEEAQSVRESWSALYPIFYYNSVMFPGSNLSLHLFEPRYRHMMSRIVNTTQAFAYVPNFANYQANNGDIALIARLKDVSFLPDGRCFLEAVLSGRYSIIDAFVEDGTMGLHFCKVVPLKDRTVSAEEAVTIAQLQRQGRILADYVCDQMGSRATVEARFGSAPHDPEGYSLWLTALAPLAEHDKQTLLNSQDTKSRLERCLQAFSAFVSSRNNPNSIISTTRDTVASALRGVMQALMPQRAPVQDRNVVPEPEENTTGSDQVEEEESSESSDSDNENPEGSGDTAMDCTDSINSNSNNEG